MRCLGSQRTAVVAAIVAAAATAGCDAARGAVPTINLKWFEHHLSGLDAFHGGSHGYHH